MFATLFAGDARAEPRCPVPALQAGYDIAITVTGFGGPAYSRSMFVMAGQVVSTSLGEPDDAVSLVFNTLYPEAPGQIELLLAVPGQATRKMQLEVPSQLVAGARARGRIGQVEVKIAPGVRPALQPGCRAA